METYFTRAQFQSLSAIKAAVCSFENVPPLSHYKSSVKDAIFFQAVYFYLFCFWLFLLHFSGPEVSSASTRTDLPKSRKPADGMDLSQIWLIKVVDFIFFLTEARPQSKPTELARLTGTPNLYLLLSVIISLGYIGLLHSLQGKCSAHGAGTSVLEFSQLVNLAF